MRSYIILMYILLCIGKSYSQDNGLYLTVQNLKEINGNYIIKATDVEKQYADTLTLISFKNAIYVDGRLKNWIDSDYGNLLQLKVGRNYIFRLFKLVIQISSKSDTGAKSENPNCVICLTGKDTHWISYYLKEAPFGVENGLADTIQYWNPILPIVDSVPKPIITNDELIAKIKANQPKTLKEKADRYIENNYR